MSIPLALTIVELFISPILSNEYCGDVVPIPSLPVAGIKTNFVVDIPTELTPILEATDTLTIISDTVSSIDASVSIMEMT